MPKFRRARTRAVSLAATVGLLTACATTATSGRQTPAASVRLTAVGTINAWGSVLAQLGGTRISTKSIITNPDTDPHDYEPSPADARTISQAAVVVENGIGYDSWAAKTIAAEGSSHQQVVEVGRVVGISAGGNPHRWYAPADVEAVADAITAALTKADPAGAGYFASQRATFDSQGLREYHQLIASIRARFAGTPIGASESIVAPLAQALGLNLITPPDFLKAISEGSDPRAADKATIDAQIAGRRMKVYVFNSQNATPDVAAQVSAAKRAGIPVSTVTETLSPAGDSFQQWQVAQLSALQQALAKATGR